MLVIGQVLPQTTLIVNNGVAIAIPLATSKVVFLFF